MDNKRLSKKFSTIFWWLLTVLPLFVYLINIFGACSNFLWSDSISNMSEYYSSIPFGDMLSNCVSPFLNLVSSNIVSAVNSALTIMFNNENMLIIAIILTWMIQVQFIHILFDVVAWLPRFCHELLEGKC